ncbi:MAG: hypothetical protein ACREEB_00875 [Caulobacteraceae bacterium]
MAGQADDDPEFERRREMGLRQRGDAEQPEDWISIALVVVTVVAAVIVLRQVYPAPFDWAQNQMEATIAAAGQE